MEKEYLGGKMKKGIGKKKKIASKKSKSIKIASEWDITLQKFRMGINRNNQYVPLTFNEALVLYRSCYDIAISSNILEFLTELGCRSDTVCPRSSGQFYIVNYYIKWVTISWTYSRTDMGNTIFLLKVG